MPSASLFIILRHIHSCVSENMAKMVACAVVGSRLFYLEPLRKNIFKFQKAQNLFAHVITRPQSPPAAPVAPH